MRNIIPAILLTTFIITAPAVTASEISSAIPWVTYKVENGVATITGTVEHEEQRTEIGKKLLAREDVTKVRNHLSIVPRF